MAAEYIGKAIVIETEEGKFNGEIHSVDVENKKLVLQKGRFLLLTWKSDYVKCFAREAA